MRRTQTLSSTRSKGTFADQTCHIDRIRPWHHNSKCICLFIYRSARDLRYITRRDLPAPHSAGEYPHRLLLFPPQHAAFSQGVCALHVPMGSARLLSRDSNPGECGMCCFGCKIPIFPERAGAIPMRHKGRNKLNNMLMVFECHVLLVCITEDCHLGWTSRPVLVSI